jgi:hypothetical protein
MSVVVLVCCCAVKYLSKNFTLPRLSLSLSLSLSAPNILIYQGFVVI